MQKKIIAALLSAAMLISVLTGCQNSGKQEGESSQTSENKETEETNEEKKSEVPSEETDTADADAPSIDATGTVYDLGGLKLPICEPGEVELTYMGNDTWCAGVSYNDGTAVQ
ncbi:MAG: hypothetical protein K2P25_14095, partial [Lachnospiraceae bacterium]|nr:hypothetical protein [Lachnospiraceae bacterium]